MMRPERLVEIRKLALGKGTVFATESSLVSSDLRHALKDAVHEIEELQDQIRSLENDARHAAFERNLTE